MSPRLLTKKTTKQGASYRRVSCVAQAHDADGIFKMDSSPEIQRARTRDFAKNKSDENTTYEIIEEIEDVGFSGKDFNRPGFKKLMRLIISRKIDFVIVTELSRLSRSLSDFLHFTNMCHQHNVAIIVIGMNFDTTTPSGKLFANQLMGMYQFEREVTAQRVSQNALARLIKDGKINGASEVLGLDLIDNKA